MITESGKHVAKVHFHLKEGVTEEALFETLKVLTFTEGMSYLEEQVAEIEDGENGEVYMNV